MTKVTPAIKKIRAKTKVILLVSFFSSKYLAANLNQAETPKAIDTKKMVVSIIAGTLFAKESNTPHKMSAVKKINWQIITIL